MESKRLEIPLNLGNGLIRGREYLGTVDWYISDHEGGIGRGSIVLLIPRKDGTNHPRLFTLLQTHIQSPNYWVGHKAILDSGDIVRFVAGYDKWGVVAHEVRYVGKPKDWAVKNQLETQRWELKFDNLEYGTATEVVADPDFDRKPKRLKSIPEIMRERREEQNKPLRLIGRPKHEQE